MKTSVRTRYITTSLLIVGIPVFVFGVFLSVFTLQSAQNRINFERQAAFSQAISRINHFFDDMENVALHLSAGLDDMVVFEDPLHYTANDAQIISTLDSYEKKLDGQVRLCLYIRGESDIYLSDGKYPYRLFEESFQPALNMNMSSFFTQLNTVSGISYIQFAQNFINRTDLEKLTGYMVPLPYLSVRPTTTVTFLFPQSVIRKYFEDTMGLSPMDAYIYDRWANPVYSHAQLPNAPSFPSLLRLKGLGALPLENGGKQYVVLRGMSESSGLTYVQMMEHREYYQASGVQQNYHLVLISLLAALCLFLAVMVAYSNYRPIKHLVSDLSGGRKRAMDENEFRFIREAFQESREENAELAVKVSTQSGIAKDQFFLRLIQGNVRSAEDLAYFSACSDLTMEYAEYIAIVGSVPDIEARRQTVDVILGMSRALSIHGYDVFICEAGLDERVVCLCCRPEASPPLSNEQLGDALIQHYRGAGITGVIWGIGRAYDSPMELHTSYLEATAALQNAVLSDHRVIYRQTANSGMSIQTPVMEQSLLVASIRHGDTAAALAAFEELVRQVSGATKSFLITQMMCFDVMNVVMRVFAQLNIDMEIKRYSMTDTFKSLPEFQRQLSGLIQKGCEQIEQRRRHADTQMKSNVLHFIRAHYSEASFSLEYASEALGISKARINAILKEDLGYSFGQYVALLRMEEIRWRLRETEDTIQGIVTDAGYLDVSNFVRKFKSIEGLTPGQYRQLYR